MKKQITGLYNIKKLHGKGNHLIVDGYCKSKNILEKRKEIETFLKKLTKEVKMKSISKPLVLKYNPKSEDKTQNGITGTIILAESNITIHTYPYYNFFCLDIFSCKEFPIQKTMEYLTKKLKMIKYNKRILKRGFYNGKN